MNERGIRIFLNNGDFQDYDPVNDGDLQYKDGKVLIWGVEYHKEKDVGKVYPYLLKQERIAGMYVRVFTAREALKYEADKIWSETDDS